MRKPDRVYIGGALGQTPTIVASSVERALQKTAEMHRSPQDIEKHGFPEQWMCAFIDGGDVLRCTMQITEPDGTTYDLYVEQYDIDDLDETDEEAS